MFKSLKQKLKRKGQEEMIGFAVIIVVVAVVLLVVLYFSVSSDEEPLRNYKGESYIQSILDYTTNCQEYRGNYLNVQGLIFGCAKNETCVKGNNTCEVLNSTLIDMINETWPAGEKCPTKGYKFLITSEEKDNPVFYFKKGNKTNATVVKGSSQSLTKGSLKVNITFTTYEKS